MSVSEPLLAAASWPYSPREPGLDSHGPRTFACLLPEKTMRQRIEKVREELVPGIVDIEEIPDGYVYWLERTEEWFRRVCDFALFESRCCDFADFEIGLQATGKRISLRITGPGETKEFLRQAGLGQIPSAHPE